MKSDMMALTKEKNKFVNRLVKKTKPAKRVSTLDMKYKFVPKGRKY